jgi:hypothetical protein
MRPLFQSVEPRAASNIIQVKLREVAQLFNSLDPSPFNEQDLDHDAEEFIVSWARELRHHDKLRLLIHLDVSGGANVHQSWRFENDQAGKRLWSGRGAA